MPKAGTRTTRTRRVPKRPPLTSEQKLKWLAEYDKMSLNHNRRVGAGARALEGQHVCILGPVAGRARGNHRHAGADHGGHSRQGWRSWATRWMRWVWSSGPGVSFEEQAQDYELLAMALVRDLAGEVA